MGLILQSPVWDTIYNTFVNIFTSIGQAFSSNVVISILTFAILLILIIYRVVKNKFTTEVVTYKAISKINEYLAKNPFITEENLVEFNRLMMKCPKTIRFQWQRYIINRNKKPSDFLNEENVITRPLRINSYKQGLKSFIISSIVLSVISACFIIGTIVVANLNSQVGNIFNGLIVPALALFVSLIYMLFGNVFYNAIMNDLYYSYTNFEKAIDRAVLNMPEAIDYEIIFTPKEIQNGIPALQEFLEQRALYEQEQIRKAKESEVEHENYNFEALGVNGSLVMERALKESELYLGNRRRLLAEIETIQTEKRSIEKDFDDKNKDYQRNLRDIREEISSLKSKIEVVTNEITRSSLRRQQAAEVEKEQNIEKEIEKETNKYNSKIAKLDAEIEAKKKEIEQCKINAEQSLTDEFNHFSEKTYKDLKKLATEEVQEQVDKLVLEKNELALLLEEKDKLMAEKLALYEDKATNYDNLESELKENKENVVELENKISELNNEIEIKNQEIFEIKQENESRKREISKKDEIIDSLKKKKGANVEIYRYFDANGNEFYFDDNQNPYYLDAEGNAVYYEDNQPAELTNEEVVENYNEEEIVDESDNVLVDSTESEESNEEIENNSFEESGEENLVAEQTTENVEEVEEEKPSKKKNRKNKKSKEKQNSQEIADEVIENQNEVIAEVDDDNDIEKTLNKLAKAAEEKMKEAESDKQENKSKKKSKK